MSKQREEFEAWAKSEVFHQLGPRGVENMWIAWQASRAAALEECLSIAKKQEDAAASLGYAEEGWAFKKMADAMSTLKEQS